MSTNQTPATPAAPAGSSTLTKILNGLVAANTEAQLLVTVGGVVIPLVKGLFVKATQGFGGQDVEFTAVLKVQQADLDQDLDLTAADVALANVELARLGLPPLVVPPTSAEVNAQGTAEAARDAGTPAPGTVTPIGPAPAQNPPDAGTGD